MYLNVALQGKDIRIIMGFFYEDKAVNVLCQVREYTNMYILPCTCNEVRIMKSVQYVHLHRG